MSEDLRAALAAAWSMPTVEELAAGTYRVLVPNQRFAHDAVSIIVRWQEDTQSWIVSDDGQTQFVLDEDFDRVAHVAVGAGAPFTIRDNELVASVVDRDVLAETILRVAAEVTALPSIWHALQFAKETDRARKQAATAIETMASEARARILEVAPRLGPLIQLKRRLSYSSFHANAPLAINRPQGPTRPPRVVSSFIDLAQAPQAVQLGLASSALLFDVVRQLPVVEQVYLVARGDQDRIDELGEIFDGGNRVTVLPTTAQGPLLESARELERELATV
jgi:hypothetical protein